MNQSQEIGQVLGDEVRACPGCGQRTWRAGDGDHITCKLCLYIPNKLC